MAVFARPAESYVRQHAWLGGVLLAYAMGMAVLFQWMPGFHLFRQSTRMVLVAAFPMAWLAGAGVEFLSSETCHAERIRGIATRLLAVTTVLCGGMAVRGWLRGDTLHGHVYWATLIVTIPMLYWMNRVGESWTRRRRLNAWTTLVIVDAAMLSVTSIDVRPFDEVYPNGSITTFARPIRSAG